MRQISRGQPPEQADALFTGIGGDIPQKTATATAMATGMATTTAMAMVTNDNQTTIN
jgi:hypothetical protein